METFFGTSVSYSATADDEYVFKNWMIDDQIHSNENSGLINISSDITLTAYFEKSLDPALSTAQSLGNNIFSSWLGYFLTLKWMVLSPQTWLDLSAGKSN